MCVEVCQAKGDKFTCSYGEEERALKLGIKWIANHPQTKPAFCTDSLSLLQAMDNLNPNTDEIRRSIEELSCDVDLLYVPGHQDVPGNELADKFAKEATSLPGPPARVDISMEAARTRIRREIRDPLSTHPTISKAYANYSEKKDRASVKSRKQGALLAQLRTGHHKSLGYYRNFVDSQQSDKCDRCHDTAKIDTVEHWLTDCAATTEARQRIFGRTDVGLQELGLRPDKVLRLAGETLEC